ncbi:amidohydrolase [Fusibacter ferrireducens]|uniref:Amidohydrolase n=1 Tax=Fusibacter ferrireducens TaxID=2785058 RepID=A0ABR9ZSC8_9FIRM|nr:amidohydrolase [Fusibacter ferrireducens]MBF4692524.1 amidohydrolase [Fusibacter ferrireducens]
MEALYVVKTYKQLHSIPEKALNEIETSKYIASELKRFNYVVKENFAGTAVIAELDSGKPGPVFAVRADMDALEFGLGDETELIHACGHDANSSMVLGAAKRIAEEGIDKGKLLFVFQPAEETGEGAIMICNSGLIDNVEEMVGIHLRPCQEAKLGEATPALWHGASKMMAFKIKGLAAHGARQHLGVNAIDAAAIAINAVNAVRVDSRVSHSAKVTHIHSEGTATNIIPETVHIKLDLRAQTNAIMDELTEKIEHAIMTSVNSIGAKAEKTYSRGLPAADYDEEMVAIAREVIVETLGESMPPIVTPGGEDFHNYMQMLNIKTAYVGIGADLTPGLHRQDMAFNLKALEYGEEILTKIIQKKMK